MLRVLAALLILSFSLLPPGICACRLEAMLFPPEAEDACPDHDDEECGCPRLQQDCVLTSGPAGKIEQPVKSLLLPLNTAQPTAPQTQVIFFFAGQHWPDSPPLYLILRALLI